MKYKTADLEGALLNQAVALIEGWAPHLEPLEHWLSREGSYCTEWAAGGPIIDKALMTVSYDYLRMRWESTCLDDRAQPVVAYDYRSALVAAMRARVASKHGDEVDL